MSEMPYSVGQTYSRQSDIHAKYKGQEQGGISTPAGQPFIFLFTGESGGDFGYRDEFRPSGVFWYTGEGQIGDMTMARGNRAVRDHKADGKTLLLFEDMGAGIVRFMGNGRYLGHHIQERPDREGTTRKAIIFELAVDSSPELTEPLMRVAAPVSKQALREMWKVPIKELREQALRKPTASASTAQRKDNLFLRSEAVRIYVLRRAQGHCEMCSQAAPFKTTKGRPYLEPHHLTRLADGGPDHPAHVIALCPNCHRRAHYSSDGTAFNEECKARMKHLEQEEPLSLFENQGEQP